MSQQSSKSGIGQDLYTYTCAFRLLSPSLLVAGRFDLSRHAVLAYLCRTKFFPSTNPQKKGNRVTGRGRHFSQLMAMAQGRVFTS